MRLPEPAHERWPQVLLDHHLKKAARHSCASTASSPRQWNASEGVDHVRYLHRQRRARAVIDRERRMVERRIKAARFPVQEPDAFDFKVIPSLNKTLVLELAFRCDVRRENAVKTARPTSPWSRPAATARRASRSASPPPSSLVHELIKTRNMPSDCLKTPRQLQAPVIDELGFVRCDGAELLFEVFSQRYERGSILVTSKPFDEWTEVFGSIFSAGRCSTA